MIDQDDSDSIILAATNHPKILDYALFRRFDDVVEFILPDQALIIELLKNKLSVFKTLRINWNKLSGESLGLSYSEICKACEDAVKDAIICDQEKLATEDISKLLAERKRFLNKEGFFK